MASFVRSLNRFSITNIFHSASRRYLLDFNKSVSNIIFFSKLPVTYYIILYILSLSKSNFEGELVSDNMLTPFQCI